MIAKSQRATVVLAISGVLANPKAVSACAACFGQSSDPMARGMNMGIFTLLVVVTVVLGGLASFGLFLARRSARFSATPAELEPEFNHRSTDHQQPISNPTQ